MSCFFILYRRLQGLRHMLLPTNLGKRLGSVLPIECGMPDLFLHGHSIQNNWPTARFRAVGRMSTNALHPFSWHRIAAMPLAPGLESAPDQGPVSPPFPAVRLP